MVSWDRGPQLAQYIISNMLNPIVTSLYRPPALVVPVITTNRPEKRPCASLFHYSETFNVEILVENFIPAIFLRLPSAI